MLHVVDLNMMQATARHHPDGRPKDPQEPHRRTHILARRQQRRQAVVAALHKIKAKLAGVLSASRTRSDCPQPTKG